MSAAITAAQVWPVRKILLIGPGEEPVVPCGIPYIVGTLKEPAAQPGGRDLSASRAHPDCPGRSVQLGSGEIGSRLFARVW